MTALLSVRFAPDDLDELRQAAIRRGVTVQQLLRETVLTTVRAAS
jgi:hypothetical protein